MTGLAGLIIAITSAAALGWKIYADIKSAPKTDAKIDAIVKHVPDALEEVENIKSNYKTYKQEKSAASAPTSKE